MPERFDESLLESPLPSPTQRRLGPFAVVVALAIAIVAIGLVWLLSDFDDGTAMQGGTEGTAAPTTGDGTVPVSTIPRVTLVAFSPDPALLYYPTMLTDGWDLCRQLEDVSQGDRFCDPDDEEAGWVQVALKDTGTVRSDRGVATGDPHGGRWLDAVDQRAVAYPAGQFLVLVVSTAEDGLVPDDLLAVAGSIPLVANRSALYGTYEVPLDFAAVTDEQLAGLVASIDSDPRVVANRNGADAQVFMETGSLLLFYGDGFTTPDFGPGLPLPRLIEGDRPVVVGESQSRGRGLAVWDQRGFGWRLETNGTADTATELALDIIERIAGLE